MAEILPAVIERRWTREQRGRSRKFLFSARVRVMLILTALLMLSAGAAAGVAAWWRPIVPPTWVMLAIGRNDTTTIERGLAIAGDAYAMLSLTRAKQEDIIRTSGLTRRECDQMLAGLHLVRTRDRLCVYITGAAGLNRYGKVVFFPSDISPDRSENAILLEDLIADIERCDTKHRLLLLDLSPAESNSPEFAPVSGVREAIEHTLRSRSFNNLMVVTSTAATERANVVPGQCRTVFGLFVERALQGDADGHNEDEVYDGRVNLTEFVSYLSTHVPSYSLHACGSLQRPVVFGSVDDFELSVDTGVRSQIDDWIPATEKTPAWLEQAWEHHRQTYRSGAFAVDTAAFRLWTERLMAAEMAWVNAGPAILMKQLEAQLADSQQHFQGNTTPPAFAPPEIDPAVLASVQGFVSAWDEQVTTAAPGAQRAAANKLVADFTKAQAKVAPEAISAAALHVAMTSANKSVNNLEPIAQLLEAYPQLPSSPGSDLLFKLADVARRTQPSDWSPEAAQRVLRIASATQQASQNLLAWPWTRTVLNKVCNEQVRGEVLLAARGYASLAAACEVLQCTEGDAVGLVAAIGAIERATRTRDNALVLLPSYYRLLESDSALRSSWLQGVAALQELDQGLIPPTSSAENVIALRQQIEGVKRLTVALESQLSQLRQPLTPNIVAQRISECNDPSANAVDLGAARRLLASPQLAITDRAALTEAYRKLAVRLSKHAMANISVSDGEYAHCSINRQHRREVRTELTTAWQAMLKSADSTRSNVNSDDRTAHNIWLSDAERYRQLQWQVMLHVDDEDSAALNAAWLNSGVNITGPLVCDSLSSERPSILWETNWSQRSAVASPAQIFLASPSPELNITTVNVGADSGQLRLRLQWRPNADATRSATIDGFLVGMEIAGRLYFAPIQLPHLNDQASVTFTLSSSDTQCVPLEHPVIMPASGTARPVYLFVRNITAHPQQVQVSMSGAPLGAPIMLAAQADQRIDLPPPAIATRPASLPLQVQAVDVATQRVLGQGTFSFSVRAVDNLATILQSQLANNSTEGVTATVDLQAAEAMDGSVPLAISFHDRDAGTPLHVMGGRMQSLLSPINDHVVLHASGIHAAPGERVRALLNVDGVAAVLVLEGVVPAPGATSPLLLVTAPSVALSGPEMTPPTPNYPLEIAAANAPVGSEMHVQLVSIANEKNIVLQNVTAARTEPMLACQPTKPAGGWSVSQWERRGEQAFDTSGIVGRYAWQAELVNKAGQTIATARLPVVFDSSPPVAARFVRPPATAVKGTVATLQSSAWDDLSGIASVQYFVGEAVNNKPPPGARLINAQPSSDDTTVWTAEVPLPSEIGPCTVTAIFTNGAGLTSFAPLALNIITAPPVPVSAIQGVVMEGSRPQAGLEVVLLHAKGVEVSRTKTGADGHFSFPVVAPGEYQVTTTKPASTRKAASPAKVDVGQTVNLTLNLVL